MKLGNVAMSNGRSMIVARIDDEPLRLRKLWVNDDRGARDESFRGVLLVSGGDGDARDGFEDVPARHAVLVSARPVGPARRPRAVAGGKARGQVVGRA